ncbi:hypothetical protein LTR99_007733 [Exophiala xenobiotica]|uniref:Uncharacterized protein n=1 Tax=Vermiconidia calcicola TaxID=1690605 RepID=A0AAV9Q8C3_9PEZI|nr:hypothetical protein LTR92_001269 [Exophiala xenobiotica]KAK5535297.1 hypothetical protein LTR25_006305 [Vermiconidia calcicola]KAK5546798.1 hypothetical protein LTR23_003169 [Chaetothyriales sp. CCFEE 6169]KAK5209506.1 hypothetical protein LTR41_005042 [Exophiala xenobiotica]KAK5223714.1 hypothetical protein LTR72_005100 [Exophiala xenobiotica]
MAHLFQFVKLVPTVFVESADLDHLDTKIANVATVEDLLPAKFFVHFCINHWDEKWPRVTRPPLEAQEVPYLTPEEAVQIESKGQPFLTKRPSQPSGAETEYEDMEDDAMDFDIDMEAIKKLQDADPERYSRLQDHSLSSMDRMALNRKQIVIDHPLPPFPAEPPPPTALSRHRAWCGCQN